MAKARFTGKGLELEFDDKIIRRGVYEAERGEERILDKEWFISINGQIYQVLGSYDPKENKLAFDEKIGPSIDGESLDLAGLTQVLNQDVHINERAVLIPYDNTRDRAIYEKGKYDGNNPILMPLVKRILEAKETDDDNKSSSDTSVVDDALEEILGGIDDDDSEPGEAKQT